MNENMILDFLHQGENSYVEFKREIDLLSARGKAEFVKDIIALSNSSNDTSYLLVGINDDGSIWGVNQLAEESIQQIVQTYIDPVVKLSVETSFVSQYQLQVGIIEIKGTRKPHKVARSIEHILRNKVYIRHGTVVVEATPEEIIDMHNETVTSTRSRENIQAGETHALLGNIDNAIKAYTEAIQLTPIAELFLARGDLYSRNFKRFYNTSQENDWGRLALKDYADAISLSSSDAFKKKVRLNRWYVYSLYDGDDRADYVSDENEFEWLKENFTGRDLGEIIFIEYFALFNNLTLTDFPEATEQLSLAIDSGYLEADVFALRAYAHFLDCNYGFALADIDHAISLHKGNNNTLADYLYLKANILASIRTRKSLMKNEPFFEAYQCISKARSLVRGRNDPYGYIASNLPTKILLSFVLGKMAESDEHYYEKEIRQVIVQNIALWYGHINKKFPFFELGIKEIVGDDFWQSHRSRLE